jgi:N-acetylneuraminic acid mutarotase
MERYIPSVDIWGYAPPMPGYGERYRPGDVLHDMCAVAVENTIYVLGGITRQRYNKANPTSSVLKFDCGTQSWSEGTPMPAGRNAAATCVLGPDIYIFGGHDGSDPLDMRPISTTLCFNTETEQWVTLPSMPAARYGHSALALDGLIYVTGGKYKLREESDDVLSTETNVVFRFDPVTNVWSTMAPMPSVRSCHDSFVLGGSMYVAGGFGRENTVIRYSIELDSWSIVSDLDLRVARNNMRVVTVGGGPSRGIELFDSLIAAARLAEPRR